MTRCENFLGKSNNLFKVLNYHFIRWAGGLVVGRCLGKPFQSFPEWQRPGVQIPSGPLNFVRVLSFLFFS